MSSTPIGIDLGTTYCAIATIERVDDASRPVVLPISEGCYRLESALFLDTQAESDFLIGVAARQKMHEAPHRFVSHIKRHIGNPDWIFEDPETGKEYSAIELSALLIRHLIQCAQRHTDTTIEDVVVSVPAYFQNPEREATREAADMAGVHVAALVDEPTAAALAYGMPRMNAGEKCLVFDLGGGTLDLSLLERTDSSAEPFRLLMPPCGDAQLGGIDFDECILECLAEVASADLGLDIESDMASRWSLYELAERIKRQLSEVDQFQETVSIQGKPLEFSITRSEFEHRAVTLLQRIENHLQQMIVESQLEWDTIDKVLLVGGTSRIPAVRQLVERVSGKEPVRGIHPDEAVALGAALASDQCRVPRVVVHSLGVIVQNETYRETTSILLPRGEDIPCEITRTYRTLYPEQQSLSLSIVQGESSDPDKCCLLRRLEMTLPSGIPAGYPIEVTFRYDEDGIVQVHAIDPNTDNSVSVQVQP